MLHFVTKFLCATIFLTNWYGASYVYSCHIQATFCTRNETLWRCWPWRM